MPKANVGPLKVPDVLTDEQVLFLNDILPTGYQAAVNAGLSQGSSSKALRQCIAATRRSGVSVPGVYAGFIHGFLFGDAFEKGLTFKMGQAPCATLPVRTAGVDRQRQAQARNLRHPPDETGGRRAGL